MSFIADLFGGGDTAPAAPAPLQATPTINDAASESAAMEERSRLKSRYGLDRTLLTPSGLGDTSFSTDNIQRTSALGGKDTSTDDGAGAAK